MSIIKALTGSISSVMSDQWKELFYCDALSSDVMIVKGIKVVNQNSSNVHSDENVITDGSYICVADGQCALVIEQGKVICELSEPGEHIFHSDRSPSLLSGSSAKSVIKEIGYRFSFGGNVVPLTQRVYYINTKECTGNSFSLPSPIPVHITDTSLGLNLDASLNCSGLYSFQIVNPSLFYKNVTGNIQSQATKTQLVKMMHSEIITELPLVLQNIFQNGVRPFELPSKTVELSDTLNQLLSDKWSGRRGIGIVSFAFHNIGLNVSDMKDITSLQRLAVLKYPSMVGSQFVDAQTVSMKTAASNQSIGNGLFTFHIQNQTVQNDSFQNFILQNSSDHNLTKHNEPENAIQHRSEVSSDFNLSDCDSKQTTHHRPSQVFQPGKWTCKCGNTCSTRFCPECGSAKPISWICKCGNTCTSNFCTECGSQKPTK